jgi:hypothetical protein
MKTTRNTINGKALVIVLILIAFVGSHQLDSGQTGLLPAERKQQLKDQLENSAFRRGVSAGVQGTMKVAPSDHSPITVKFGDVSLASWNLLSDEHTWNFLFNVAEKQYFAEHKRDGKPIAWRDVFSDFGDFVLSKAAIDQFGMHKITITNKLMNDFIAYEETVKRPDRIIKDAQEFVALVLDNTNAHHEDMKASIVHIMEIKFAMAKGYLRWEERLKKIEENKLLVRSLGSHDILCFQECTNPQDMLTLLRKSSSKNFALLDHVVKAGSKDHCAIIYDENKYMLEKHNNFGLAENRKPCIMAKFRSLKTNTSLIIGSIHHPGTGASEISLIIKQVNLLLQGATDIPVMVLGDYNHQSDFYKKDTMGTGFDLKMPNSPTMAGFEYGNLNVAIDGVLTNRPAETSVKVLEQTAFASQVELPIEIKFEI